jgi:hypothetical protein
MSITERERRDLTDVRGANEFSAFDAILAGLDRPQHA